jgi:hypothetical protein
VQPNSNLWSEWLGYVCFSLFGFPPPPPRYLLNHLISPPSVVASFLLTFHSFLRPDELLDQLLSYFKKPPGPVKKSAGAEFLPEQLRVISILQKWLFLCPRDFSQDQLLRESLMAFAEKNKFAQLLKSRRGNSSLASTSSSPPSAPGFLRTSRRETSAVSGSIVLGSSRATPVETARPRKRSNSLDELRRAAALNPSPASPAGN